MNRHTLFAAFFLIILSVAACSPREIEVTRIVEVPDPIEVTRIVEVEGETEVEVVVTEIVEVTRIVESAANGQSGELIVALTDFPTVLDLSNAANRNDINVAWQMYDSLVFATNEGDIVPALAENWSISADGTEYTFFLRDDVTFHNGEPFNAESVVFSWERGRDPENRASARWNEAESVEAVDDFTVRITTESPDPLFLYTVATRWAIVPPGYIAEVGEEGFAAAPIGTGPFTFVEWDQGRRIVLRANPNYWDEGVPKLETVIFRPFIETFDRVSALEQGQVHIAPSLNPVQAQNFLSDPDVNVIGYPEDTVYYIAFDNVSSGQDAPTADPRVRQAMNYAVDRENIVNQFFGGSNARLSTGLVTPANLGYEASTDPFPYDPERAVELLIEAGLPDGFAIGMACPSETYINFEQVCQAVQEDLAVVGIEVELEFIESAAFFERQTEKSLPPLIGDRWPENRGEALPRLLSLLGGGEFTFWQDPALIEQINTLRNTIDREERAALYREIQQQMVEDPPFIYLYELNIFEAVDRRVQNYRPRADQTYFLKDVFLASDD